MTAPAEVATINLNDAEMFIEGRFHEALRLLRNNDPVHWNEGNEQFQGFWAITKYEDVMHISRNPELFISSKGITGPSFTPEAQERAMTEGTLADSAQTSGAFNLLITMDPPRHVKMRRLVNKGFTPRAVNAQEGEIRRITNEILDKIAGRSECDFVLEVASQLPLAVICGMMGIEEKDWPLMFDLTNRVLGSGDAEYQTDIPEDQRGTGEASRQTAMAGVFQMMSFFTAALADRRETPRENDLISILLEAEVDGEKLTDGDLLAFCFLLIVAGNETTRNAISGGLQVLCEHSDQKQMLMDDPSLMDSAIEEILRWVSPVHHMARNVTADTEIRSKQLKEGDRLIMWYPSVNRDEDIFENPYTFDIKRTPNDHLAFGIGEHFCLGAGFARKELRVMFEELFRRFPDIEMSGPPERLRSNFINGIKHLPVRYTPER